jgi:dUTPase
MEPGDESAYRCPAVYDQGQLGSCTANALAACFEFLEMEEGLEANWTPSRLFIYYNERDMEETVMTDSGAQLRDGVKSLNSTGVCHESEWPYIETKFTQRPTETCYVTARRDRVLQYRRVKQDLRHLKHVLATSRRPIAFGFSVYESFESSEVARTGQMPMPNVRTEKLLGGHAVCAVGYSDADSAFIVRNSWGESWGDHGYFLMPYKFIIDPDFASDFWVLDSAVVEQPAGLEQQTLTLTSPNSDSSWKSGMTMSILWESTGDVPAVTLQWAVNSWSGMMWSWQTIAESVPNSGSYSWIVPPNMPADTRYYLRLSSSTDTSVSVLSEYFALQ